MAAERVTDKAPHTGGDLVPEDLQARAELVRDGLAKVPEAARFLGISKSMVYLMVDRGDLPHVPIGRAVRIPWAALHRYAAQALVTVG